tara:strand:- start:1396 stop:2220 length:825 start_codon:yes stop_codon:yes gene_type:complete
MPYIGKAPQQGIRNRFIYSATAGQTSFTGSDANALTLSYPDGEYVDVYQNGVLLKPAADYTSTSGTSVVLVTGASVNDVIEIIVYDTFSIANSYTKADSDTRFVNVAGDTMTGNLAFASGNGIDFSATSDGTTMTSELLDDYEEGSWTPTASDAESGGNTTTTGHGRYTKIGRMVFVNADLVNINTSGMTSSNSFFIQGLPFANNDTVRAIGMMQTNRITNADDLFAHLSENGSSLSFKHNNSANNENASTIQVSDVNDDEADMFGISLFYSTS